MYPGEQTIVRKGDFKTLVPIKFYSTIKTGDLNLFPGTWPTTNIGGPIWGNLHKAVMVQKLKSAWGVRARTGMSEPTRTVQEWVT